MIRFSTDFPGDFADPRYSSIDPVSAIAGSVFGGLASLFGGGGSKPAEAAPAAPTAPPPPAAVAPPQQQAPQKSATPSQTPSFIGSSAVPTAAGSSQKTLLGQ